MAWLAYVRLSVCLSVCRLSVVCDVVALYPAIFLHHLIAQELGQAVSTFLEEIQRGSR